MLLAMAIAAGLCIFIGCYPQALYTLLPYPNAYSAYDATHVLAQCQILFFSALAFVWLNLRGLYPPELPSTNLDVDWLLRKVGYRIAEEAGVYYHRLMSRIGSILRQMLQGVYRHSLHYCGPRSRLVNAISTDIMVLVALGVLIAFLLYLF